MDRLDRRILEILQKDATLPVAEIAERVGLSNTPCWRRIQRLEKDGVIQRRVALLDRKQLNVGVTVFVRLKTRHHNYDWLEKFAKVVAQIDEVVEFYRMIWDTDSAASAYSKRNLQMMFAASSAAAAATVPLVT